jgi:alanine-glyoxylate transaminase / serine-glyoxylate transaminase / serine-pyruvate transaminase
VPDAPVRLLCGPGPSDVEPDVLAALARPVLGHLDPAFLQIADRVKERLRRVFRTRNDVTFAVSGTGSAAMECALVNTIEPGDDVVVGVAGLFGQRLAEIAKRCGANVRTVETEPGTPLDTSALANALTKDTKLLAVVHAETSTGVWQPLDGLKEATQDSQALLVVDAVTSLGGIPVEVDAWGVDVCYSGTQKCLSVPPGLAPITFSVKAMERIARRAEPCRSWYLDVTLLTGYWGESRVYHHTAPTGMLAALDEGLRIVLDEGLDARWRRHEQLGRQLQTNLEEMGFSLLAPKEHRLPQLTTARLPGDADEKALRKTLLERHDIEVGAGWGPLAGRGWRIGLMGASCRPQKLDRLLLSIRDVLSS